ncbi:MAG TPA: T9SS type A sorting domain-containing protein, partial [Chitinophagaceae bacterium]
VVNSIQLLPNPARDDVQLKVKTVNAIAQLSIRLIDSKGSVVMVLKESKGPGIINVDLPVHRVATGHYTVAVYDGQRLIASTGLEKL